MGTRTDAVFSEHNCESKCSLDNHSNSSHNSKAVQVVQFCPNKTNTCIGNNVNVNVDVNVDVNVNSNSPMSFMGMGSTGAPSVSSTNQSQSKENLDEYLTELRDQRSADYDRDDSTQSSNFTHLSKASSNGGGGIGFGGSASLSGNGGGMGGMGGMTRSKTRSIFSSSEKFQSHPDLKDLYDQEEKFEKEKQLVDEGQAPIQKLLPTKYFGRDIKAWTNGSADEITFDKDLRNFMEIHIAKARRTREEKHKSILRNTGADAFNKFSGCSAASNTCVPYPTLRQERRFLYDVDTYPLHQYLADILGVSDLSLIHQHPIQDKKTLMKPLLDAKKRQPFHQCYDNFVTSFCIPLLHSLAIGNNLFNDSRMDNEEQKISYRYQAFPCIRVNRPGEFSIGPHCDMSYGHSMGNINFHIPLTPTYGTNALYAESHPGREDWHPLKTKSIGLGYSFDGARNLHFTLENSTVHTRVSLDFRIAIHRETKTQLPPSVTPSNARMMMEYSTLMKETLNNNGNGDGYDVHNVLCSKKMLQDNYSSFPGYYEEAYVDLGTSSFSKDLGPGPVVYKRNGSTLMMPDKRVGFPF
jgi:hypothetical protein